MLGLGLGLGVRARARARTSLELGLGLVRARRRNSCIINKWLKQTFSAVSRCASGSCTGLLKE